MFTAALLTIAETWKEPKCVCIDERTEKTVQTYNGIMFSLKKEENAYYVATWKNLEDILLSELSHSEKHKYYKIPRA